MAVKPADQRQAQMAMLKQKAIEIEKQKELANYRLRKASIDLNAQKTLQREKYLSPALTQNFQFGEAEQNTGANMNDKMLKMYMDQNIQAMNNRIAQADNEYKTVMSALKEAQSRLRGNLVSNESAVDMKTNLDNSLPEFLRPGNVGDINKVFWPFWFTAQGPVLAPEQSGQGVVSVSQEAAFICVAMTKTVLRNDGDVYTAAGSQDQLTDDNRVVGLRYSMRDAQSSRTFHDKPQHIDTLGSWLNPTVLPRPLMFLPNSQIEFNFVNDGGSKVGTYLPFITMFGYRLRIENAKDMLSLVQG